MNASRFTEKAKRGKGKMNSVSVGDGQRALCTALSQDPPSSLFPHCLEGKTSQSLERRRAGKPSLLIKAQAFVSPTCGRHPWGRGLCPSSQKRTLAVHTLKCLQ